MNINKKQNGIDDAGKKTILQLLDQIAEYRQRLEFLQQEAERYRNLSNKLQEDVKAKDSQLYQINKIIQSRETYIENLKKQLVLAAQDKERVLQEIMSGTVMRTMIASKLAMDKVIPPGSWGSRAFQKSVRGIQALTNPGLKERKKAGTESSVDNGGDDVSKAAEELQKIRLHDDAGRRLSAFLQETRNRVQFPVFEKPTVSIVILTYNNARYFLDCLKSIIAHTDIPYQIIVVDNGSSDGTPELMKRVDNAITICNETNLRFIAGCNMGADKATAEYILFLNDDTEVTAGWLAQLYKVMKADPQCGAVGSKILLYNGALQEAGSIIWADGSVMGYGRGDDPDKPEYCYLREVDYCSACSLLVRRDVFNKIGGYDVRYYPAYYEDTDLCMAIIDQGYKIIYQPASIIYHHEYKTNSVSFAQNYMNFNRPKFVEKWKVRLQGLLLNSGKNVLLARNKRNGVSVLILEDRVPASHFGAGFPRSAQIVESVAGLGYEVTLFPTASSEAFQPITGALQQLGIEVMYGEALDFSDFAAGRAGYYDVVIISRPHNMRDKYEVIKKYFPRAAIIYDAEAIFALREIAKAEIGKKPMGEAVAMDLVSEELALMNKADIVITVSEPEKNIILEKSGKSSIEVWGYPVPVQPAGDDFKDRKNVLFVGSFIAGEGSPNEDAAIYFARDIFPSLKEKLRCQFNIVGSSPTVEILGLVSMDITVTGYVKDLSGYYQSSKIFVVPTRFAAGIPLKLIEAMSYGIPAVVTQLMADQLGLKDGVEVLVAGDRDEFIQKSIDLYSDEILWRKLQSNALNYIKNNYDPDILRQRMEQILLKGIEIRKKRKK